MTKVLRNVVRAALLPGIALAQQAAATAQQPGTTLRVTTRLVEVPVTVTDSRGKYVDGLDRADFEIAENGSPQKIKYFARNAESLTCAILLDTTGSMEKALPRLKNSVVRFIEQFGPEDSIAVYSFAETLVEQQPSTKDKSAAKRAVLKLRAGGRTALFDALTDVTREVARQPGKKAVIVFTDGDDNSSMLTAQAAVNRATRDAVPLFTIAEGEASESPMLKKTLRDLSKGTGGEAYEVPDVKGMEDIFLRISGALQHTYLITYQPPFEPDDGHWRHIEMSLKGNKYRVRAKEGYFPQ